MQIDGLEKGGQARLQTARVGVAGAGGLGSVISIYLSGCSQCGYY